MYASAHLATSLSTISMCKTPRKWCYVFILNATILIRFTILPYNSRSRTRCDSQPPVRSFARPATPVGGDRASLFACGVCFHGRQDGRHVLVAHDASRDLSRDGRWVAHPATARLLPVLYEGSQVASVASHGGTSLDTRSDRSRTTGNRVDLELAHYSALLAWGCSQSNTNAIRQECSPDHLCGHLECCVPIGFGSRANDAILQYGFSSLCASSASSSTSTTITTNITAIMLHGMYSPHPGSRKDEHD